MGHHLSPRSTPQQARYPQESTRLGGSSSFLELEKKDKIRSLAANLLADTLDAETTEGPTS
jgi:hypothetical protein